MHHGEITFSIGYHLLRNDLFYHHVFLCAWFFDQNGDVMKDIEILTKARELISDPDSWTQGAFARNRDGLSTEIGSDYAVCWCANGALARVTQGKDVWFQGRWVHIRHLLEHGIDCKGIVCFNDSHEHEEVLEMFDKAIELSRLEGL